MELYLEKKLQRKDKFLYNRYRLIRNLIFLCEKENRLNIGENFYLTILLNYFEKNFKVERDGIIEDIYNFFEDIITLYQEGYIGKFNFVLIESNLNSDIKEWIKRNKEIILSFLEFYLNPDILNLRKVIFENEYFKIVQIKGEVRYKKNVPFITPSGLTIRIMIHGKVMYNNGVILEDGYYIISDGVKEFSKCMLLDEKIEEYIIILKESYIKTFNVKEVDETFRLKLTSIKEYQKVLNYRYLRQHPYLFLELISNFLRANNLLNEELPLSKIKSIDMQIKKLEGIIKSSIKEDEIAIEKILVEKTGESLERVNNFLLENIDFTVKKWIMKLKTEAMIEEVILNDRDIKSLEKEYHMRGLRKFRYNLKNTFNLSIKDIR